MTVIAPPPGSRAGRGPRSRRPRRSPRKSAIEVRSPSARASAWSASALGVPLPGGGEPGGGPGDAVGEPAGRGAADLVGGRGDVVVLLVPGAGGHADGEGYDLHQRLASSRARSVPTGSGSAATSRRKAPVCSAYDARTCRSSRCAEQPGHAALGAADGPAELLELVAEPVERLQAVLAVAGEPDPRDHRAGIRTEADPGRGGRLGAQDLDRGVDPVDRRRDDLVGRPRHPAGRLLGGEQDEVDVGVASADGGPERGQWCGRRLQLHAGRLPPSDRPETGRSLSCGETAGLRGRGTRARSRARPTPGSPSRARGSRGSRGTGRRGWCRARPCGRRWRR